MSQTQLWRIRPFTIVATVVFGYAFLAVNLCPRVEWCSLIWYMPSDVYEHGWPVSYMSREHIAGDMGGVFYPPWPFGRRWPLLHGYGNPPLIQFTASSLVLDVLVAVSLLTLSVRTVHSMCASCEFRLQFSIRQLLAFTAIACVCLGLTRILDAPIAYAVIGVLPFVFLIPNFLVMLSLPLAVAHLASIVRSLLVARRPT